MARVLRDSHMPSFAPKVCHGSLEGASTFLYFDFQNFRLVCSTKVPLSRNTSGVRSGLHAFPQQCWLGDGSAVFKLEDGQVCLGLAKVFE